MSEKCAIEPNKCFVKGTATDRSGSPTKGLPVTAYDYDSVSKITKQLGASATTDVLGAYRIDYTSDQLKELESESLNLVILAFKDGEVVAVGQKSNALQDIS